MELRRERDSSQLITVCLSLFVHRYVKQMVIPSVVDAKGREEAGGGGLGIRHPNDDGPSK